MHHKILLPCTLTTYCALVVLLALGAQAVLAVDYGTVQITSINAPASVGAGQPVTVSITISYDFMQPALGEGLVVALLPHTEVGNPYPIISASSNCQPIPTVSLCFAQTGQQPAFTPGTITVSFTLNAPSTPETWRPSAFAVITYLNFAASGYSVGTLTYQVLTITVT